MTHCTYHGDHEQIVIWQLSTLRDSPTRVGVDNTTTVDTQVHEGIHPPGLGSTVLLTLKYTIRDSPTRVGVDSITTVDTQVH